MFDKGIHWCQVSLNLHQFAILVALCKVWGLHKKKGPSKSMALIRKRTSSWIFLVLLQGYRCLFIQVDNLNIITNLENYWFYGMLITHKKLDCDAKNEWPFGTTWTTRITIATSNDNSGVATFVVNKTSFFLF